MTFPNPDPGFTGGPNATWFPATASILAIAASVTGRSATPYA